MFSYGNDEISADCSEQYPLENYWTRKKTVLLSSGTWPNRSSCEGSGRWSNGLKTLEIPAERDSQPSRLFREPLSVQGRKSDVLASHLDDSKSSIVATLDSRDI